MLGVIADYLSALLQLLKQEHLLTKEAIINMLGDIAEKRTRDIYLLRFAK